MQDNYNIKLKESDSRFLQKTVFVSDGELIGFRKLCDVLRYSNLWHFKKNFIMGHSSYEMRQNSGGIHETYFSPIDLFDAQSGKQICAKGALTVYKRFFSLNSNIKFNIGFKRYHRKCKMRHPKTLNLLRATCYYDEDEGEPEFSGKLRAFNVTSWDDYWRYNQRSWKKQRSTQYKK